MNLFQIMLFHEQLELRTHNSSKTYVINYLFSKIAERFFLISLCLKIATLVLNICSSIDYCMVHHINIEYLHLCLILKITVIIHQYYIQSVLIASVFFIILYRMKIFLLKHLLHYN